MERKRTFGGASILSPCLLHSAVRTREGEPMEPNVPGQPALEIKNASRSNAGIHLFFCNPMARRLLESSIINQ